MILAYDEFVDFIAAGATPQGVVDFRLSEVAKAQVAELFVLQKSSSLSADQSGEPNHHLLIELLMRLAKARARQHVGLR